MSGSISLSGKQASCLRGGADNDHCLLNNNKSMLIQSFETVSPGVMEATILVHKSYLSRHPCREHARA